MQYNNKQFNMKHDRFICLKYASRKSSRKNKKGKKNMTEDQVNKKGTMYNTSSTTKSISLGS